MEKSKRTVSYEPKELISKDELTALQTRRMKNTLLRAYSFVPYYKKKWDEHGVHPDDFTFLEDIKKFPFTTKEDLRLNYPFGLFATPMSDIVRLHASSGTTGKPTVVGYTQNDINMWADLVARSIRLAGGHRGDILHVSYGYGLFTGGLGAHYGAERLGCTVVPASGGFTDKQVTLLNDFNANIIMVTPSYMLNIIEELENRGIDPRDTALEIGIFGAEPWSVEMKNKIEEKVGISAIDIYGLSEMMGPGVACESFEDRGDLYVWEDSFYPEIVDRDTFEPIEDGQEGELVFTTLTREALPIIRYRTKDLSTLYQGDLLNMRKMKRITGRTDDMMIIRGVNVFPSQIEEILLKIKALCPCYQLVITREHNMDDLSIDIEPNPNVNETEINSAVKTLKHKIKSGIGISVKVNVKPIGGIPRSQGKAQRVVDKRKK
ncbi:phenylacetate--CoA ligase family protein [Sulfurospirillum sp. 1612]|uniref:phenylacetate--CoA ligase family protein n=1 Tax=Sulfurospirillum sp. 1612 TaxID=3094835 RepID=UPI002F95A598